VTSQRRWEICGPDRLWFPTDERQQDRSVLPDRPAVEAQFVRPMLGRQGEEHSPPLLKRRACDGLQPATVALMQVGRQATISQVAAVNSQFRRACLVGVQDTPRYVDEKDRLVEEVDHEPPDHAVFERNR
jgi:hypothetical protein